MNKPVCLEKISYSSSEFDPGRYDTSLYGLLKVKTIRK